MKNIWQYRHYYFRLPLEWLKDRYRDLIAFWQRGKRGWANRDTWNMDVYLATVLGPMLRHLAATDLGCPPGFGTEIKEGMNIMDMESNHEAWKAYLEEIASGFDAYLAVSESEDRFSHDAYKPAMEKMRKLFDYYHALWS